MSASEIIGSSGYPQLGSRAIRHYPSSWEDLLRTIVEDVLPGSPATRSLRSTDSLRKAADGDVFGRLSGLALAALADVTPLYSSAMGGGYDMSLESQLRLRATGETWAATGLPLDDLLRWFGELNGRLAEALLARDGTSVPLRVADMIKFANLITREFLAGATRRRSPVVPSPATPLERSMVAALIDGRMLSPEAEAGLSPRYLVVVVRHATRGRDAETGRTLLGLGQPGTMVLSGATETVGLVPDGDRKRTGRFLSDLEQSIGTRGWIAVTSRPRAALRSGYREAADVANLAARREPGLYRVDDVLLEYAAVRNDRVAEILAAVIDPLLSHDVLLETADALIEAGFNRNVAAKRLFIHRSTVDYRLGRIRELTGYDPMSGSGIQVLSTAMAVRASALSA